MQQQLQQLSEKHDERDAISQAGSEHLRQLSSLVSGGVGLSLQLFQTLVKGGVPPSLACNQSNKRSAASMDVTQMPTSKSARQRYNADLKWQQQQQKKRVAAAVSSQSEDVTGLCTDAPSTETNPVGSASQADTDMQAGNTVSDVQLGSADVGTIERGSAVPMGPLRPDIPGTGQVAPWQDYKGAYRVLNGNDLFVHPLAYAPTKLRSHVTQHTQGKGCAMQA